MRTSHYLMYGLCGVLLVCGVGAIVWTSPSDRLSKNDVRLKSPAEPRAKGNYFGKQAVFHWGPVPKKGAVATDHSRPTSNIRRSDYAGHESCSTCHAEQYEHWSTHPHRWMNALATDERVIGDFSSDARVDYMGGEAWFFRQDGENHVRLSRDDVERTFRVVRTIGSRFYQSYVGRLVKGPEPRNHPLWNLDVHIPFTYWIKCGEWVPETHLSAETPDEDRVDAFNAESLRVYSTGCASCHTTPPLGDWLWSYKSWKRAALYTPHAFAFDTRDYLDEAHPELVASLPPGRVPSPKVAAKLRYALESLPAPEYAVSLGISCEACHNGCREHVENPTQVKPAFFAVSPHLTILDEATDSGQTWGRTAENINFICARCHSAANATYAAGMGCFNSQEVTDAFAGHCYLSEVQPDRSDSPGHTLSCAHCHNPHKEIGPQWTKTPAEDDASCIQCHQQFDATEAVTAHTHHAPDSAGSRCMNCHMPKITEGLQDVVRTHTIFSPTNREMLLANHPNACNVCHFEQPIDWTIQHLRAWYGEQNTQYPEELIKANYPHRDGPAALGWLKHSTHESTRLIGIDVLTKASANWALPDLIETLDDPFLINRQFAQQGLETMLGIDLGEYGFKYYRLHSEQRRKSLDRIREAVPGHFPRAGTVGG